MKKVLIIGSKGFIGSHLYDYYLKLGYYVWGADVIVDYKSENYFLIDASNANYHFIFESNKFDVCINCSGAASVPDSLKNPTRDFHLNAINVFSILDAIRHFQPECKFINLSSAAVYGNPSDLPIKETLPIKPLSPYGFHKMYAEQIMKEFNDYFNIPTCSLRIFSAYGERLEKQLFWDLYNKVKSNTDNNLVLFGSGNESRDFIYISDLVVSIDLALNNSHFNADVINIANGKEIFIKDAVAIFFSLFNKRINYSFSGQERKGDPLNWVADISRLQAFGYKMNFSLEVGLENYYKWISRKEKE